ncbi:hypothetical protein Salat_2155200 [Sesamum alatum]|uniref:Uncharacterized protein n=1 Tax=Sesamum alatum TaxID=300844 RepID=A0AAE2CHB8_9LAMI|nr:hypothetical protein Salat_2155200 [Sesamum alatum]
MKNREEGRSLKILTVNMNEDNDEGIEVGQKQQSDDTDEEGARTEDIDVEWLEEKEKSMCKKELMWLCIEEQGVDISHQPRLSSYLQRLQQQPQQCLSNSNNAKKRVKIREPAPYVDGERPPQEQASSGSTPSIVKGGKKFVTLSNLSQVVSQGKQKKDKNKDKGTKKM